MKKLVPALAVVLFFSWQQLSAEGIEFVHDKSFQEVLAMAKAEGKLIFMDCYTVWCGPCKRMAANTFPDPEVGDYFNAHFINTKFEMQKDADGPSISSRYGIRAYPTLLWLDGDGNLIHQRVGALDPQGLLEEAKKAMDPTPGILAKMRTEYKEGKRDVNFLSDFLNTLSAAGEKSDDVFKEYLDKLSDKDLEDNKHAKTIFALTGDIKSPGLSYLMKNKGSYVKLVTEEVFDRKVNQIAEKAVRDAPMAEDKALFDTALDLVKSNKASDYNQKMLELSMDYYPHVNDWAAYDKSATQYIKKYASDNTEVLNQVAWNYFLNMNDKAQLQKATKWASEAINKDNKYTYNLTYAYLQYKQDNLKEAELACDYAIIRAKEENVIPTSANALKEAIKKSLNEP